MKTYSKIEYIKPNIAYFPNLYTKAKHSFSWGKGLKDVAIENIGKLQAKKNVQEVLENLEFGEIEKSFILKINHDDKIYDIAEDDLARTSFWGNYISCDAVFTKYSGVNLIVKVADCTTAIVFGQNESNSVVGLIHSGRKGVQVEMPYKAIEHLKFKYNIKPENIEIGILPALSKENRKFQNIDDFDLKIWDGFIEEKDGFYYPDETGLAIDQYKKAGIVDANITKYNIDTYESAKNSECFSHKYWYDQTTSGKEMKDARFMLVVRKD